jgi:acetate kinase
MNILVLNCGSSSIKYQLISMNDTTELKAKGLVERIGLEVGEFTHRPTGKDKYSVQTPIKDHSVGIKLVLDALVDPQHGVLSSIDQINAVGHRVAHGGEYFKKSALIDKEALEYIRKCSELAPLHNPANLMGIEVMQKMLPNVKQVAVFDTSFHQTMPPEAYLYAIPFKYYEENKIRRYGFHGTSHKFVAPKAAQILGKKYEDLKIIVCHLGNGASICAVKNGQSVDTSMGFTPVEGLVMGTRAGDLDLGALLYIAEKEGFDFEAANKLINKQSGLLGITGKSSDMRDINADVEAGDQRSIYAHKTFCYRVKKYIGAYAAAMDGVDIIAFTGGIGENGIEQREEILKDLKFFGVDFDPEANQVKGKDAVITKPGSKTVAMVVTTDEELVIATDTYNLTK